VAECSVRLPESCLLDQVMTYFAIPTSA
jgi:hypothetical protein